MKRTLSAVLACLVIALAAVAPGHSQSAAPAPQVAADFAPKVESFIRDLFALGPNIAVKVGAPTPTPMPGLLQVALEISLDGQTNRAAVFASPDAKFIVRGEIHDTGLDPFAANRNRIKTDGFPSKGPADAKVTIVEFADFQCPSCKQMHEILKQVLPRYPQVRLVFKDLPLAQIHPWAMTAALAGRCAYQQKPEAFWTMHDGFFDNQQLIGAGDAWTKSLEFATKAGLDDAAMRTCMASPEAKAIVEGSLAEARSLSIANTPTAFVNGRRVVGPDAETLEQYIRYEVSKLEKPASPAQPAKRP